MPRDEIKGIGEPAPRPAQPVRRLTWPPRKAPPGPESDAGERDGWRILSYMLGGMILYGGIGWLIGYWTGLSFLFPVGMIGGLAASVALIILRVTRS